MLLAEQSIEDDEVQAAVFLSADQLVTAGAAETVQVRSTADLKVTQSWPISEDAGDSEIVSIGVLQDGNLLAIASSDGMVRLWQRDKDGFANKPRSQFQIAQPGQLRHLVTASGKTPRLIVATEDGAVRIWQAMTGDQFGEIPSAGRIASVAVSTDGTRVSTVTVDGQ